MSKGVWLSLLVGLAAAWGATALADLVISPGWAILLGLGVAYATMLLTAYVIDVYHGRRRLPLSQRGHAQRSGPSGDEK